MFCFQKISLKTERERNMCWPSNNKCTTKMEKKFLALEIHFGARVGCCRQVISPRVISRLVPDWKLCVPLTTLKKLPSYVYIFCFSLFSGEWETRATRAFRCCGYDVLCLISRRLVSCLLPGARYVRNRATLGRPVGLQEQAIERLHSSRCGDLAST